MKRFFAPSVVVVFTLLGCEPESSGNRPSSTAAVLSSSSSLSVEAYVTKGFHSGMGMGSGDVEYVVTLKLKNSSSSDFIIGLAEAAFVTASGKALGQPTLAVDGNVMKVPAFGSEEFRWSTNGYTSDLLMNAAGQPIIFRLTLKRGGQTVFGPIRASLPSIKDLPYEHQAAGNGQKLNFY